jgi:hypothetical protein
LRPQSTNCIPTWRQLISESLVISREAATRYVDEHSLLVKLNLSIPRLIERIEDQSTQVLADLALGELKS